MTAQPIDAEALRRLADAATPGPWPLFSGGEYVGGVGIVIAPDDGGVSPANAEFIAAARTALPALLDALAAAEHRATRAEAQSAIRGRAVAIHRQRAREAEARVKAVGDVLDNVETGRSWFRPVDFSGTPFPITVDTADIRRALDP